MNLFKHCRIQQYHYQWIRGCKSMCPSSRTTCLGVTILQVQDIHVSTSHWPLTRLVQACNVDVFEQKLQWQNACSIVKRVTVKPILLVGNLCCLTAMLPANISLSLCKIKAKMIQRYIYISAITLYVCIYIYE